MAYPKADSPLPHLGQELPRPGPKTCGLLPFPCFCTTVGPNRKIYRPGKAAMTEKSRTFASDKTKPDRAERKESMERKTTKAVIVNSGPRKKWNTAFEPGRRLAGNAAMS